MGTRGRPLRRFATALAVMGAAIAVPLIAAPPASAALPTVTFSDDDSVVLPSFPTTEVISLDQIDPDVVDLLTKVTITATVDGGLEGALRNLSETVAKTLTAGAEVGITVTDAGIIEPLEAVALSSGVFVVPPSATVPVSLSDTDSDQLVLEAADITPAMEALLVGTGEIDFTVVSSAGTNVGGPAPYLSTGEANGIAAVSIEYEYEPVACPHDPELPADSDECVPPPPPCVDFVKIEPVVEGTYLDGTFTITDIYDNGDGPLFDWTSTVPVFAIAVKGGPDLAGITYDYEPDGATSDEGLHAPFNENSGKWYGLSHLEICVGGPPPEEELEIQSEGDDDPKPKKDDKGKGGDNGGNGGGGGNTGVTSLETQSTESAPEPKPAPKPAPKPEPAPEPEPKPEPQVQEEETKPPPKDEQVKKNDEDESEGDKGDDTEKGAE